MPELSHGKYTAGYKKGLTIIHGASVEYTCDEGWVVSVPDVSCYLGMLSPAPPACVTPAQTREVIINSEPLVTVKRGGPDLSHSVGKTEHWCNAKKNGSRL